MDKNLVLIFITADDKKKTVTIANPKEGLNKATVYAAMQAVIDNGFFATELVDIDNAYYKATEVIALA